MFSYFLSRLANSNKPWFKNDKPWLVIGKGPSFNRIHELDLTKYYTFGLNHVNWFLKCDIGHCIDLNVLSPEFVARSKNVLIPWHPHIKFRPSKDDLNQLYSDNDSLKLAYDENKLFYYNCSTFKGYSPLEKEIVKVRYFSGEIPFYILGMCGVREIHSIGLDGGRTYHPNFVQQPLTNGQDTFDKQFPMINHTCAKFGINWQRL